MKKSTFFLFLFSTIICCSIAFGQDSFITTWQTTTGNESITIPTSGTGYDYSIDWGDGTVANNLTGAATHTYVNPGTHTISISGTFPRLNFRFAVDRNKIFTIEQWGTIAWDTMEEAFRGCSNLEVVATDVPDLTNVSTLKSMFNGCSTMVGNASFDTWDTSTVTNMEAVFLNASSFNSPIGSWDLSNVTIISSLFLNASSFNQPIGDWNTGSVTQMFGVFNNAVAFNQPLANWDTSNVTTFNNMFNGATSFNQPLNNWNVTSAFSNAFMFANTDSFDQSLSDWDISAFTSASNFFSGAGLSRENYDATLIGWATLDPGETQIPSNITFDGGNSQFCDSESQRQDLIDNFNWTITDGGLSCPFDFTNAFITTWDTNNSFTPDLDKVTIPTFTGETYNYAVHWGDGAVDTGVTGNITHTYATPGVYTISIIGDFPRIHFAQGPERRKILTVEQWGAVQWSSMEDAFNACDNLDVTATDVPDLANVTNLTKMFASCGSLVGTGSFGNWDVSNVTNLRSMFSGAGNFNQNIGNWNTQNVTDMGGMFINASSFNQAIGNWNVSQVVNMGSMFVNASSFDQAIGNWNVANVQDMGLLFNGASSFNQDIGAWDVSAVWNMAQVFDGATAFNQNITNWNVGSATSMFRMFANASSFNQDIGNWDVGSVSGMRNMFQGANAFDQDLGGWDIGSLNGVSTMQDMFSNAGLSTENYDATLIGWATLDASETQIPSNITFDGGNSQFCDGEFQRQNLIDNFGWIITDDGLNCPVSNGFITTWQTTTANEDITIPTTGTGYDYSVSWGDGNTDSGITANASHTYAVPGTYTVTISGDFPQIFFNNTGDKDKIQTVEQWGNIAWSSMQSAFSGCTNMDVVATDTPDLSNVTDMSRMFLLCRNMVGTPVFGSWNTSNIQNMSLLFLSATSFNQDINTWDTGQVTNMQGMFGASEFNQFIGDWDVSQVTNMSGMFEDDEFFDQSLANWNVTSVTTMETMFLDAGISTANYDATLIGWAGIPILQPNVIFDMPGTTFCEGAAARQAIIDNFSWVINDFGEDPNCVKPFVTVWQTTANNESISIPTFGTGYNYNVDWGDGTITNGVTGDATHTYTTSGEHTVSISGDFPRLYFLNNSVPAANRMKLLRVEQWGDIAWTSMEQAFYQASNMDVVASDVPNLSAADNMDQMFLGCTALVGNSSFNSWDVSTITKMSSTFLGASAFNQDLSNWNVGNVQLMFALFSNATSFNQPLNTWDVSNVTTTRFMFEGCTNFNQPLDNWNVAQVTDMAGMFKDAAAFNQQLSAWDVSQVTSMQQMFSGATAFNQPIGNWNVGQVSDMNNMFNAAIAFNQPIGNWDVAEVQLMYFMFFNATAFDQDIGNWDIGNLEPGTFDPFTGVQENGSAFNMFGGTSGLSVENYDALLSGWGTLDTDAGETQIPTEVRLGGGNSLFCDGEPFRIELQSNFDWEITDAGKDPACNDTEAPTITCPPVIVEFAPEGEVNIPVGIPQLPTATDNVTSPENITFTGVRSDGGPLPVDDQFELFPVGDVIITWTATDEAGNVSEPCEQLVSIAVPNTGGNLDVNGVLTISDTDNVSDDTFSLSVEDGNLIIESNSGLQINGLGVVQRNARTVAIPLTALSSVTIDGGGGTNLLTLQAGLDLDEDQISLVITNTDVTLAGAGAIDLADLSMSNGNFVSSSDVGIIVNAPPNSFTNATLSGDGTFFGIDVDINTDSNVAPGSSPGIITFDVDLNLNTGSSFDAEVNGTAPGTEHDQLVVNGGVVLNSPTLNLLGGYANGASDEIILISNDGNDAVTGTFAGLAEGDSVTFGDFNGTISYEGGDGNDVSLLGASGIDPSAFVTTWTTFTNGETGQIPTTTVTIPTVANETYNFDIDWGDGTINTNVNTEITHDYGTAGTYTISITGTFPRFLLNDLDQSFQLLSIENWGDIEWSSMENAFAKSVNLKVNAQDAPNLSQVTSLKGMFQECLVLEGNDSFNSWDVSTVTDMSSMFFFAQLFDQDLNSWNTANVVTMESMFQEADAFNGVISNWNVANVENMQAMFNEARAFNQPIGNWNVGKVTNMRTMFFTASSFNQPLGDWDISAVNNMSSMFQDAIVFNQDLNQWDVSTVASMEAMFSSAQAFNGNISDWDVGAVQDMSMMFQGAGVFDQAIGNWNVSNVTDMSAMFGDCSSFNQDLNGWNVSNVTNMLFMFGRATSFNGDITSWNVSQVTNFNSTFSQAIAFNQDIGNWDVSAATSMSNMFSFSEFNQDIGNWDVNQVTDMDSMFEDNEFFDQSLGNWNVGQVTTMRSMFLDGGMSTENYDSTLIGWSQLPNLQPNVEFGTGSFFCNANIARQSIIDTYGWNISDSGVDPNCVLDTEAPVITCPSLLTINAGVSCQTTVTLINPTATDNISTNFTFIATRQDGLALTDPYFVGETIIEWTATDEVGNISESCEQSVIVTGNDSCWAVLPALAALQAADIRYTQIEFDTNGTPYLVVIEARNTISFVRTFMRSPSGWEELATNIAGSGAEILDVVDLAIHPTTNEPYIVYRTVSDGRLVNVRRFDGMDWILVGEFLDFPNDPRGLQLEISDTGIPFVSFQDNNNGGGLNVQKFENGSWSIVGATNFTSGDLRHVDLKLDSAGNPYVFNIRVETDPNILEEFGVLEVHRLENGVWEALPTFGTNFMDIDTVGDSFNYELSGNNVPYVFFKPTANEIAGIRYQNTTWEGLPTLTVGAASFDLSTVLDGSNVPYLATKNGNIGGFHEVYRLEGANWQLVGNNPFTVGAGTTQDLNFDTSGVLHLSYVSVQGVFVQNITPAPLNLDSESPVITCPENVAAVIGETESEANLSLENPTATDNVSTDFVFEGIRSDALPLTDPYAIGTTTITWTATDQAGNVSESCEQTITVAVAESLAELVGGTLTVKDCTTDSDDTYGMTIEDGFLVLSNNTPIGVSGNGVEQRDANTVAIPLNTLTTVTINGGNGEDTLTLPAGLDLNTVAIDLVTDNTDIALSGSGILDLANLSVNNGDFATNTDVTVNVGGEANFFTNATLSGTGTINGVVNMNVDSNLAPGTSPGIVTTGNLNLDNNNNNFEVNGTNPGTEHDQLVVMGTVTIVPGTALNLLGGYANTVGDEIVLIENDDADTINGTFTGLDEGTAVNFGAFNGTITYTGGDGNDVVLVGIASSSQNTITDNQFNRLFVNDVSSNSDESFVLSTNNGNLRIQSNGSISSELLFVQQIDANTVEVPLVNIINSIIFIGEGGSNDVLLSDGLSMTNQSIVFDGYNITAETDGNMEFLSLNGIDNGSSLNLNGATIVSSIPVNLSNDSSLLGSGEIMGGVNMVLRSVLSPGNGIGAITTGNLFLQSNSNSPDDNSVFNAEVNGEVPGTEHDQLIVNGAVELNGVNLNLVGGYANAVGDEIILIDNDGTDGINGTFDGLAEGSSVSFGEFNGTITYVGGDGNDMGLVGVQAPIPGAFVTTWKTDNPGPSNDDQITIPIDPAFTYNYSVDWGDGSNDTSVTGSITHTYASAGTYDVSITGDFPAIRFLNQTNLIDTDNEKLLLVKQWGTIVWQSFAEAFRGCSNLDVIATDTPDLSSVTQMFNAFRECTNLMGNGSFSNWDTSAVINMGGMFGRTDNFNQPIGNWDVSSVTDMRFMFFFATSFNQPLNSWNVGSVVDMDGMFSGGSIFDQPLGNWDISSLTTARDMLDGLSTANYDNLLNGWSTLDIASGETQIPSNVIFSAGNSQASTAGEAARQNLVDNFNWSITDAQNIVPTQGTLNPANASNLVPIDQTFTVVFNELVQFSSAPESIFIFDLSGQFGGFGTVQELTLANGDFSLADDGNVSTLTINPSEDLPANKLLSISIPPGLIEDSGANPWEGTQGNGDGFLWHFTTGLGDTPCTSGDVDLEITFDDFAGETSWELRDQNGTLVDSASYPGAEANSTVTETFSGLVDGTYTFTIFDAFGDGICCANGFGSFTVSKNGNPLFSGGRFLTEQAFQFCIDASIDAEVPIINCPAAITQDAGTSCSAAVTLMDPTAIDNVSTNFTFEGVRSDGFPLTDPYFVGETTIVWTATDEAGNVSESCEQLITVTGNGDCWFDIGPEITGVAGDRVGFGVTINALGNIAAYVRPNANGDGNVGNVVVLENVNGTWSQLGNTFPGGFGDFRGNTGIDLNDAGDRLAVSVGSGNVQVYELVGGTWQALGNTIITVGPIFNQKVDFDATGNRLAIGYAGTGQNSGSGNAAVYELQGGQWVRLGSILEGIAAGDNFGRDVSLSADGTRLAVGAYQTDTQFEQGVEGPGYVQVFNFENGDWSQLGDTILCNQPGQSSQFFGISVGLNDNGNRLVVGDNAAGFAKVFELQNGTWQQVGNRIAAAGQPGYQVDINGTGDIILIGDFSQPARILQWDGTVWNLLGQPIYADVGQDLAMNRAGDRIILGGPEVLGGKVAIYEFAGDLDSEAPTITCPDNLETVIGETETEAMVTLEDPTATDNVSTAFTFEGVRSDALSLSDPYPIGTTTITWTATDQAGNTSASCEQQIIVVIAESQAEVNEDGEVDVKDCTSETDDAYMVTIEEDFLVLSNNAPIAISGEGVEQRDANTVAIPLAGLTSITINGGPGEDNLVLPIGLDLADLGIDLVTDDINVVLEGDGTIDLANLDVNNGDFAVGENVVVNVSGEANFFEDATLSGMGTIMGTVNMNVDSNLAPGASPGIITINGDLVLDNNNNDFEVNGTDSGTEHDQVVVNGTVTIVQGTTLNLLNGYANADGDQIVLIDNDGTDAINGEFDGLVEGAAVAFGDFRGTISYVGGDGNDLVLTGIGTAIQRPFVTTWQTDGSGVSEDNQIMIPTFSGETYNYTVDWGDGTIENISTSESPTHTYTQAGIYQVSITGDFPRIFFNNEGDRFKIRTVEQWGDIAWTSMANAFHGTGVNVLAADTPNLSGVSDMSSMFEDDRALSNNPSFGLWDVGTVTDMSRLFMNTDVFQPPIEDWDVSQVTTMAFMFYRSFFNNIDISNWDVSSVTDMSFMFFDCEEFDSAIGIWDVSKVTNMSGMFSGALDFNEDIGGWDVSKVTDMSGMFSTSGFNQDIGDWDVSSVTDMFGMFARSPFDRDIGGWDVSSVSDMSFMFSLSSFNQDLGNWDISNLSDASNMFESPLSVANYDSLLIGWSTLDPGETQVPSNVLFTASNSQFCFGGEARQNLIDTFGWTITDGGSDPACPLNATLSVTSFNLIDADEDKILMKIVDGDEINISDLPTLNLNIQAVATDDVGSVRLELTGPQSNGRTENVAPYALFGDRSGDYSGNVFPLGDYGLTATPYSNRSLRGTMGTALGISFSFVDEDPLCGDFEATIEAPLMGPSTCGGDDGSLTVTVMGGTMPFSFQWSDGQQTATASNLVAGDYTVTVTDANGCSKILSATLEDPALPEVSLAPFEAVLDTDGAFALIGGSPVGGTYSGEGVTDGMFDPGIGAGNYEITYSFTDPVTNCTNSAIQVLTVNPSVSNNAILGFVLVDADTNEDIGPITEGTVFDFGSLPSNLNIRAEATDDVESVFLEISGGLSATRRENVAPYALFGDRNGDYFGRSLAPGSFTVSATPYTGNNLRGEMGSTNGVSFSIGIPQAAGNAINLSIYPNPTVSSVMASFDDEVVVERIQVFDIQGRLIRTYDAKRIKDGEGYRLDVYDMPAGSYFIRTQDTKGFNYQKQLVIER